MTVGEKIRIIRKEKKMTLVEVAQASSCTAGFLSQVERDLVNPSLSSLRNICTALEVPLFALLDDGKFNEALQSAMVTSEEQRVPVSSGNDWRLSLLNPYRKRSFDHILMEAEPGFESGDCTSHKGEEGIFVVQGIIEVEIDQQSFRVPKGSHIYFDSSKPHRWKSVGEEKLIAISTVTPSNL